MMKAFYFYILIGISFAIPNFSTWSSSFEDEIEIEFGSDTENAAETKFVSSSSPLEFSEPEIEEDIEDLLSELERVLWCDTVEPSSTQDNQEIHRDKEDKGNVAQQYFDKGDKYANGKGVTTNPEKAVKYYRKAAEEGHTLAMNNLGYAYDNGIGIAQNKVKAHKWYLKAAKKGNSISQYNYALMCEYGEGTGINLDEAYIWYKKSAKAGDCDAQYKVGIFNKDGLSVEQNYFKALNWLKKSAKQGHKQAQYELGKLYQEGKGGSANYSLARKWLKEAAAQDVEDAKEPLQALQAYETDSEDEEDYGYNVEFIKKDQDLNGTVIKKLQKLNDDLQNSSQINWDDYSEFSIALYRGVHYLPENFPNKEERIKHLKDNECNKKLYCSAAYESANKNYLDTLGDDKERITLLNFFTPIALSKRASDIKTSIDNFKENFPHSYSKFHEVYSNNHQEFHKLLENPLAAKGINGDLKKQAFINYRYFFNEILSIENNNNKKAVIRNPFVSFSLVPKESVKYALGNKSFHTKTGKHADSLTPDYDEQGVPKNVYLGKSYIALVSLNKLFSPNFPNPYFVARNHAQGKIKISNHHGNNILKENEVSLPGYCPTQTISDQLPIRVPSFKWKDYPNYYREKYGISGEDYYKYQTKILDLTKQGNFKELNKLIQTKIYNHIEMKLADRLYSKALDILEGNNSYLVYPGFENDFVLFPLSDRSAEIYRQIKMGQKVISIFPETGKTSLDEPNEISYILQPLKKGASVKDLTIRNLNLGHIGFKALSEIVNINITLTTLILEKTHPSREGIKTFFENLSTNRTLESLSLKGNKPVVAEEGKTLANSLQKNSTLRFIDLGDVGFNEDNITPIKNLFVGKERKNKIITDINLDGNNIKEGDKNKITRGVLKNKQDKANTEQEEMRSGIIDTVSHKSKRIKIFRSEKIEIEDL